MRPAGSRDKPAVGLITPRTERAIVKAVKQRAVAGDAADQRCLLSYLGATRVSAPPLPGLLSPLWDAPTDGPH